MAHVAVTTTLPVLGCLWLEKVTHTHAKNKFNTLKRSQPRTRLLSLPTIHTKHGGQHGEGKALITRPLTTSLRRSPSTTSDTTLISASPLHSRAPRSFSSRFTRPSRPGLLHCTLQTQVLACSLGYFSDPLLLKDFFEYLGHLVDAVLFTQPLKPFPKGNFISLANFSAVR